MNNISYDNFIKDFNDKKIKKIIFSVDNYNHYKHCEIEVEIHKYSNSCVEHYDTVVRLVSDNSETVRYEYPFNWSTKLFKLGKNKTYTLKQIWECITIDRIIYTSGCNKINVNIVKRF